MGTLFAISDLHIGVRREPADRRAAAADRGRRLADRRGRRRGAVRRHRVGADPAAGTLRPGGLGARQPRAVDASAGPGAGCAASNATSALVGDVPPARRVTPEDHYPVWTGAGGPVTVAPLFVAVRLLVPRRRATNSKEESLERAYQAGVVCTDEMLLHPDPYPSREAWCAGAGAADRTPAGRLRPGRADPCWSTTTRWSASPPTSCTTPSSPSGAAPSGRPTGTCGSGPRAVVYGHLHIPRTTWYDGVRFEEVSLGYPREWRRRPTPPSPLRAVLTPADPG